MTTATTTEASVDGAGALRSASPGAPSAVSGWRSRLRPPNTVEWLVIGIAAIALVMRVVELGEKALHHDESLHAAFSYYFAEGRGYTHDPLMHGPFQFHVIAAMFKLFGDGDAMARMPAALGGTALVLTPLLLRKYLGATGTVAAVLFLAFSPALLYYSRFARGDIFVALWTVLMVIAIWRYKQEGHGGWLALLAASLSLYFSTKETVYLTVAVLLIYLEFTLTAALLRQTGSRGELRVWEAALFLPFAWLIVALWRPLGPLRERLGLREMPRDGDLMIVLGTLTLPWLAAAIQIPLEMFGAEPFLPGSREYAVGLSTVLALLFMAAAVGLSWDWRRWFPLAVLFFAIALPLYTTGFTNDRGMATGIWGGLDYWLEQHGVNRGDQPKHYYLMLVPTYEFVALIPALIGGAWLLRRGDRLFRLFGWWFLGTFVALSVAGEKMPWLLVHLALPLALMAALVIGRALPLAVERLRRTDRPAPIAAWAGAGIVVALFVLFGGLSLRNTSSVVYGHPDTPTEPLIYTQTSPDVPRLSREIHELAKQWPDGRMPILVDSTDALPWPWAWYLRDIPSTGYVGQEALLQPVPPGTLVIGSLATLAFNPAARQQAAEARQYTHRWWFPEEGYKQATFSGVVKGVLNGELIEDWARFMVHRVPPETLGRLQAEVLFPYPPGTPTPQPQP